MTQLLHNKKIANNYNANQIWYSLFLRNEDSQIAHHHGFWYPNTGNLKQALRNVDKEVVQYAKIKSGDRVLDAGCGSGATALYVAAQTGAHVTGITLSTSQLKTALQLREKNKHKLEFYLMDYTHTNFPDNYFDAVYAVESACYSYPKSKLLREVYRILKPGGNFTIIDGYTKHKPKNIYELNAFENLKIGFELEELATAEEMTNELTQCHFEIICNESRLREIKPTINQLYQMIAIWLPFIRLLKWIPLSSIHTFWQNALAVEAEHNGALLGIADYRLIVASKKTS